MRGLPPYRIGGATLVLGVNNEGTANSVHPQNSQKTLGFSLIPLLIVKAKSEKRNREFIFCSKILANYSS